MLLTRKTGILKKSESPQKTKNLKKKGNKRHRKSKENKRQSKSNKTKDTNDSRSQSEATEDSHSELSSENDSDSDQQSTHKEKRTDVGTPQGSSKKQVLRSQNDSDSDRQRIHKKQRTDAESPQSSSKKQGTTSENDPDSDQQRSHSQQLTHAGTPRDSSKKQALRSENNSDLDQQRSHKKQSIDAGTLHASNSKQYNKKSHPSTPLVNTPKSSRSKASEHRSNDLQQSDCQPSDRQQFDRQQTDLRSSPFNHPKRLNETDFQEIILKYMEDNKSLQEQNQNLLVEISQTLRANIRGAEKPDKVPESPITDCHVFEIFDKDLNDPVINKYMKNRLLSIGGVEVRAVVMGMMKCVITDHLALQFNWQGQNEKKPFQSTNLQVLIRDTTKQFFNKKIRATDKDIKGAMQDWLKQASNRIKSRTKKTTAVTSNE